MQTTYSNTSRPQPYPKPHCRTLTNSDRSAASCTDFSRRLIAPGPFPGVTLHVTHFSVEKKHFYFKYWKMVSKWGTSWHKWFEYLPCNKMEIFIPFVSCFLTIKIVSDYLYKIIIFLSLFLNLLFKRLMFKNKSPSMLCHVLFLLTVTSLNLHSICCGGHY